MEANKAPKYYVEALHVYSTMHMPKITLNEFYTAEELSEKFEGVQKSYYANAIQYHCENFVIMFKEL